jgi:hypothetical protein
MDLKRIRRHHKRPFTCHPNVSSSSIKLAESFDPMRNTARRRLQPPLVFSCTYSSAAPPFFSCAYSSADLHMAELVMDSTSSIVNVKALYAMPARQTMYRQRKSKSIQAAQYYKKSPSSVSFLSKNIYHNLQSQSISESKF